MRRAWPYLLFAAVTLAVFWKFLLFGHSMYAVVTLETQLGRTPQMPRGWFIGDFLHARVADNIALLKTHLTLYNAGLKAGELRLWNPYLVCGLPTYADTMVHPFYPPHLLLHAALPPDAAYEIGLMLHLFFAGTAMFWLLQRLGRSPPAAAAGALVWMLFGYQAMWFSTSILEGVSVFGPLTLLAIHRGLERKQRSDAALGAIPMGMVFLGSHPQHALFFFLFVTAWLAREILERKENRREVILFSTTFALLSVGIGLAAILTRLDSIANGYRDPEFDNLNFYSEPGRLLTHVSGVVLGKVYFPHPEFELEFPAYAGLAAFALAVVGAVRNFSDRRVRFVAIFAAAALAVAFLKPLAALFLHVPILSLSPPSRWIFVAGFCIAILAAWGFDSLATSQGRVPLVLAAVTAVFLVLCLIRVGPFRVTNGSALETLIGFGLATGAAFAARRWRLPAAALAFAAVLFELLPPFVLSNWHADPSVMCEIPEPIRVARERAGPEPWRAAGMLGASSGHTPADLTEGNNLLTIYGVETVAGFEAILPTHAITYGLAARGIINPAGRTLQYSRLDSPLLEAANFRFVFLPPSVRPPPGFARVHEGLYENPSALPRARLVGRVRAAADETEAEKHLRSADFNPRREVILQASQPPSVRGAEGTVTWKDRSPDRIALEVTAKEDTILVLSDTDYPGWEATINDQDTPIYRANVAFRAIAVPAGSHRIEFRFRPESARNGMMGSLLFVVLAAAYGLSPLYRRRP